jgi:hypothetical protein
VKVNEVDIQISTLFWDLHKDAYGLRVIYSSNATIMQNMIGNATLRMGITNLYDLENRLGDS